MSSDKSLYKLIVDPAGKLWLLHSRDPVPDQHVQITDEVIYYYGVAGGNVGLLPMFHHLDIFGGIYDSKGAVGP